MEKLRPFKLIIGLLIAFAVVYFFPWKNIDWGIIKVNPGKTITVTGTAESTQKNEVASFSAGVSAVKDNKNDAINEVNSKIDDLTKKVKEFGIKSEDVKTENLSIYQEEQTYYDDGVQKTRPGQWRVSNSIRITLREAGRATDLANLLTSSGATNVYGPDFSIEDTETAETALLGEAIKNAQDKASQIASSSGAKLGKILNIVEGSQVPSTSRYYEIGAGGAGGGGLEPGSTRISKTVTVTFEIR